MTMYKEIESRRIHIYSSQKSFLSALIPPYKHLVSSLYIADILGVGWNSPWSAWYSLRGGEMETSFKQRIYENFKWMPVIRRVYESHVLRSVDLQFRQVEHSEESWALGTLLGYTYDPIFGEDGVVDFNLSRDPDLWAEDGSVIEHWDSKCGIPANIAMQAYWTMLCTGLRYTDIVVAFPSWSQFVEIRVIRLLADEDLQRSLLVRVASWRDLHLMEGIAPKIDDSRACSEYLFEKYRYDNGQMRKPSKDEEQMMKEYNALTDQIRQLQSQHRTMRNELFDSIAYDRGIQGDNGSKAVVTRGSGGFQVRVTGLSKRMTHQEKIKTEKTKKEQTKITKKNLQESTSLKKPVSKAS